MNTEFTEQLKIWKDFVEEFGAEVSCPAKAYLTLYAMEHIDIIMDDMWFNRWEGWLTILPQVFKKDIVPDHLKSSPLMSMWSWWCWYKYIYCKTISNEESHKKENTREEAIN